MAEDRFVPYSKLTNPRPPQWTCGVWEDLARLKGILWCDSHDKPLTIVALDGSSRLCTNGAERDPYESAAMMRRGLENRGVPVKPLVFWERSNDDRP